MISNRFKQIRKYLNKTSEQFANELNIAKGTVSKVENNNQIPGGEILCSLKETFGVNINWLLTGEGEMFLNESSAETKDLSPEEKQELIKKKFKEQFDITEKNYELIFDGLANNQEIIILFLKALNGDPVAKQFMKNMFHN